MEREEKIQKEQMGLATKLVNSNTLLGVFDISIVINEHNFP